MGQSFSGLGSTNSDDMGMGTKLLESGTKGLLNGFQNYQQQKQMLQQPRMSMGNVPVAQNPDLSYLMPKGNNLAFYGGS